VRRARLIANPVAGTDEAPDVLHRLEARLRPAYDLDVVLTAAAGDAGRAAAESAARGDARLFVGGGDGTLNEALNGVAAVPGALTRTAIGIVPLGTGNDFAAALGLPTNVDEAVEVLLQDRVRHVDLGRVNGRHFANVSAGGFLAEVSEAVDPALKSVAGRLAYLLGGAKVLFGAEPFICRVDAQPHNCLLFAVCNAPMVGGGRLIAPDAVLDDGQLDVCLVEDMDLITFLARLREVADGSHIDSPGVKYFRATRLTLEFDRPLMVNADGEVFEASRCEYEVLPDAARFLAPPDGRR
jgi:diacylglycerol kinase (ATP)